MQANQYQTPNHKESYRFENNPKFHEYLIMDVDYVFLQHNYKRMQPWSTIMDINHFIMRLQECRWNNINKNALLI